MDIIILKDTFANGEPVKADDKPQSFDDSIAKQLIAANKAIPAPDKPAAKAPKKKAAKKD
mgnify:CR=1 FL=1|tara:strand:+ start:2093 stop:2272 length:180 start_codon:yes stop_codon:yes gene_type:complete